MNWTQLKAIMWLRWRLSRNQFHRGGQLNAVLSVIFLIVMLMAGAGLAVGGVIGGWFAGANAPAPLLLAILDGVVFLFLVFWFSGLMIEIQRSESVDLTKLLHVPVTLQQVFVFNYVASHFTPSIMILLPGMLGVCVGLALGGGTALALLLPVVLGFIFVITAWTYCLRGWLSALMVNKRKKRAILVWVTIIFVVFAQTPNLVFNSPAFRRWTRPQQKSRSGRGDSSSRTESKPEEFKIPNAVLTAHLALPLGWPGYSALALKDRNVLIPLAAVAGSFLIGALGLRRAYQMTMRFYRGAEEPSVRPNLNRDLNRNLNLPPKPHGPLLVERRLPWLADDTAALTLATLRSLLRAPELKMALIMPVVMGVIMLSLYATRWKRAPLPDSVNAIAATLAVAGAAMCLAPTMSNVFGLDRNGFRALVLLPTERRQILFAKNLAFFPFIASVALVLLVLVKLVIGLSWNAFLAGALQAPAAFLLFSILCNFLSIVAPFRLAQGSLNASKPKAMAILTSFGSLFLIPFMLLPIMIPPVLQLLATGLDWPAWLPVNLLATAAVLTGVIWLYNGILSVQGQLLQRREQKILREVTEESE